MVVFDAGILIKLLDPRTKESERDKLEYLVSSLQKARTKILIPTPALSEFYVKADPDVVSDLKGKSSFVIASFDEKAAIECAISIDFALKSPNGKKGAQKEVPWQKIKFDHQIVAICKSNGAQIIYSEDKGLRAFAKSLGLNALCIEDLPDNPASAQKKLDLQISENTPNDLSQTLADDAG